MSSRRDKNKAAKLSCEAFRVAFILTFFCGIILYVIAPYLIIMLYGERFTPTIVVLKIIIPSIIFYAPSSLFNSYFNGIGKARIAVFIQMIPLIFHMIIGYILIKKFGLIGASIGLGLGTLIHSIVLSLLFLKLSGLNFKYLIPRIDDFNKIIFFIKRRLHL